MGITACVVHSLVSDDGSDFLASFAAADTDEVVKEIPSPNGKRVAVILYGHSGGMFNGDYFLALRDSSEPLRFDKKHQVKNAEHDEQGVVFSPGKDYSLDVTWQGNKKLIATGTFLGCIGDQKPSSASTYWKDIEVVFPTCNPEDYRVPN